MVGVALIFHLHDAANRASVSYIHRPDDFMRILLVFLPSCLRVMFLFFLLFGLYPAVVVAFFGLSVL